MALVVGEDTFISVEDADVYVAETYTDTNAYRTNWEQLSVENKEALLRRSTRALNKLKYQGRVKYKTQKLAFPREIRYGLGGAYSALFVSQYYDNRLISGSGPVGDADGMIAIAEATIENALGMALLDDVKTDLDKLNIRGLVRTSQKINAISETYAVDHRVNSKVSSDIFNNKVYSILNAWLLTSHVGI